MSGFALVCMLCIQQLSHSHAAMIAKIGFNDLLKLAWNSPFIGKAGQTFNGNALDQWETCMIYGGGVVSKCTGRFFAGWRFPLFYPKTQEVAVLPKPGEAARFFSALRNNKPPVCKNLLKYTYVHFKAERWKILSKTLGKNEKWVAFLIYESVDLFDTLHQIFLDRASITPKSVSVWIKSVNFSASRGNHYDVIPFISFWWRKYLQRISLGFCRRLHDFHSQTKWKTSLLWKKFLFPEIKFELGGCSRMIVSGYPFWTLCVPRICPR